MLFKPSPCVTIGVLVLSFLSQGITAAPLPSEATNLEARSADTSPAGGLWARSTIILEREADADAEAPSLSHRQVEQANPSSVTGTGVKADCQWRWVAQGVLDHAHCTVQDTGCDGHEVFAVLQIDDTNGYKEIGKIKNASGCRADPVRDGRANSYRDRTFNIKRARVHACVDDNGPRNTCFDGNWVTNPLG